MTAFARMTCKSLCMGPQLVPTGDMLAAAQEAVEAWSAVAQQPNLIVLRSAFVSSEVEGAAALFLVHDLHPGAVRQPRLACLSCLRRPASVHDCLFTMSDLAAVGVDTLASRQSNPARA